MFVLVIRWATNFDDFWQLIYPATNAVTSNIHSINTRVLTPDISHSLYKKEHKNNNEVLM